MTAGAILKPLTGLVVRDDRSATVLNCVAPGKADDDHHVEEVYKLLGTVAWLLFFFTVIVIFRKELRRFIDRISNWEGFGQKVELKRDLERLQEGSVEAAGEPSVTTPVVPSPDEVLSAEAQAETSRVIRDVLSESARSPRLGLMLLASELEGLARRIAANIGHPSRSLSEVLRNLQDRLPGAATATLPLFLQIRNRVVHGSGVSNEEVLRAVDSGIRLYSALETIKVNPHVVLRSNVPLFLDEQLLRPLEGATGVLLESQEGDPVGHVRIFPTTKTAYRERMEVSWEWNMSRVFPGCWYREELGGEVRKAFDSAAEFVGRDVSTI